MNATLVWSARPGKDPRFPNIRIGEPGPCTKLFQAIVREKFKSSRVVINNNRYTYRPTEEYNSYVIRFRGVK